MDFQRSSERIDDLFTWEEGRSLPISVTLEHDLSSVSPFFLVFRKRPEQAGELEDFERHLSPGPSFDHGSRDVAHLESQDKVLG